MTEEADELTPAELRALRGYIEALEELAGSGTRAEVLSKFDDYWTRQLNHAFEKLGKIGKKRGDLGSTRD